tara:strand:+ start:378 stop:704 length:327 start_codon:yes stop_codon:yes gene_type:complete
MTRTPIRTAYAVDTEGNGFYCVAAETASGSSFVLHASFDCKADATRQAAKVDAAGSIDEAHWEFWRTIYGSEDFLKEEADAALYADSIRAGACSEDDPSIPANIRTLL